MKKVFLVIFLHTFMLSKLEAQCVATCSAYAVSPVTFSVFASNGTTLNSFFTPTADDGTVSVPIGFNFDFYCTTYYDVIVCTNGFMQFDYGVPLSFGNPAYSHPPQSFPSTVTPNGLVALQMNDFDLNGGGSISYTTVGTAPNRQFILTYTNVPIWYNTVTNVPPTPLYNSGQIVLYETTNIIEIHTANIPVSPYYGTQGIENTTGTLGATPPGRNFAAWSGTNSAYQFSPFTPGPPLTVTGSTLLCEGVYDFYQATFIPGATSYNWSFPPGWTGTSSLSLITATAGSSGVLSVTATYTCGTSAPAIVNISVTPSPTLTINGTPAIICSGKTVTLNATGALSYTLNPGNYIGLPPFTDVPYGPTVYSVSGTNSLGCESFKNTTVSIQVKVTPTVTVNNGDICLGDIFNMNAMSTATSYSVIGSNGNFLSVTPTLAAEYSYTVIGNGGNGCFSDPVVSSVTVHALPSISATASRSVICKNELVTLTATGAATYSWNNFSFNPIIVVSPTINSSYTVTGTDIYGCKNTATLNVVVDACTAIDKQVKALFFLELYPNPTTGPFKINMNSLSDNASLEIYTSLGKLIKSEIITEEQFSVTISEYPPGIYYVKLKNNGKAETLKLIKQ